MKRLLWVIFTLVLILLGGAFYWSTTRDSTAPPPKDSSSYSLPFDVRRLTSPTLWESSQPGMSLLAIPSLRRSHWTSVSGTRIVWCGATKTESEMKALKEPRPDRAKGIFLYDIVTREEIKIAEASRPEGQVMPVSISGDWVIWVDYTDKSQYGSDWIFFAYNLNTKEKLVIDKGEDKKLQQGAPYPRIHGDKVVWCEIEPDSQGKNGQRILKIYDLATRETTTLAFPYFNLSSPAIHGDRIVYYKAPLVKGQEAGHIFLYDLKTGEEKQVSSSGKAYGPAIWGDKIAWLEAWTGPGGGWMGANVFLHDLSTGKTQQLTLEEKADHLSIGEVFVAWHSSHPWATVYNLVTGRLEVADKDDVYVAYTSENILVWTWIDKEARKSMLRAGDPYSEETEGKRKKRVIIYNPP